VHADLLRTTGDGAAAMARYREALAIARQLSAADPGSLRRKGLCGQILTGMGAVAAQNGSRDEAARDFREGLDLLKLVADRRGATADDASGYAETLLTCPLKEFADPRQALVYARKAVSASRESRWLYLDQAARAAQSTGDSAAAREQERKAIALLPAPSPKRKELEARLAQMDR
jgi:tetratricopeptide (TPR) repeat protein